ncbi:MAG TPA: Fe-S cluster assembly ATPase SufC [Candidatus Sulfotelmatobacter sp.]|jgi:Fe-S cluster assembly ATP-binding protein|nr:Fe-S cluster assembly ATPase SufC [Candidatus Sulfotelmatobacter sp.]
MKDSLVITNLYAGTKEGKEILRGVSLTIKKGEIHAIMGPNGGGKSTLAQVLMGHPEYVVTNGKIILNSIDIVNMTPDQRAKQGLFLGFQYPVEIAGVNFGNFLRMAVNENLETGTKKISPIAFRNQVEPIAKKLGFSEDIVKRFLNQGFSGGEKKKAEILQLATLKPDFAILDEPDSGLDVDALRYIGKAINSLDYPLGLLLITHYQRILHYIKPHFVHIVVNGKIVKSGNSLLAKETEEKGYEQYLR